MINIISKAFKILKISFCILGLIMIIGGCIIEPQNFSDLIYDLAHAFKYFICFSITLAIYVLLRINIPKIIGNLNTVNIEFKNKNYSVSRKRAKIIQDALNGNKKSQYKLITEFYDRDENSDFIPKICFYFTKQISNEENDLGVIVQLGNMYEKGIGVRKNRTKALEIYKHALDLYDNPPQNLYIPNDNEYRQFLTDLINSIN